MQWMRIQQALNPETCSEIQGRRPNDMSAQWILQLSSLHGHTLILLLLHTQ